MTPRSHDPKVLQNDPRMTPRSKVPRPQGDGLSPIGLYSKNKNYTWCTIRISFTSCSSVDPTLDTFPSFSLFFPFSLSPFFPFSPFLFFSHVYLLTFLFSSTMKRWYLRILLYRIILLSKCKTIRIVLNLINYDNLNDSINKTSISISLEPILPELYNPFIFGNFYIILP